MESENIEELKTEPQDIAGLESDITDKKFSVNVSVLGLPNAGKSTLMNNLVGEILSAVTRKPGTTRSLILGIKTEGDMQLVIRDCPGLLKPKTALEEFLLKSIKGALKNIGILLVLVDVTTPNSEKFELLNDFIKKYKHKRKILVLNKVDRSVPEVLEAEAQEIISKLEGSFDKIFKISALKDKNFNILLEYFAKNPSGPGWNYNEEQISENSLKFFAAEITRQKLFNNLEMELPYSVLVNTETIVETDGEAEIQQVIYASRKGHQAIIIGAKGSMIKKIGIESRLELSKILEKKVKLYLRVKVKENWQKDSYFVNTMVGTTAS